MVPFSQAIHKRVAIVAIGLSAVRRAGAPGVVAAASNFFACLPLQQFATSDERSFRQSLDGATERLSRSFPEKGRSWGLARKCMNTFLRDAFSWGDATVGRR
jgi:hypothetical protein